MSSSIKISSFVERNYMLFISKILLFIVTFHSRLKKKKIIMNISLTYADWILNWIFSLSTRRCNKKILINKNEKWIKISHCFALFWNFCVIKSYYAFNSNNVQSCFSFQFFSLLFLSRAHFFPSIQILDIFLSAHNDNWAYRKWEYKLFIFKNYTWTWFSFQCRFSLFTSISAYLLLFFVSRIGDYLWLFWIFDTWKLMCVFVLRQEKWIK